MAVFTTAFVAGALGVASTSLAASVSAFALNAAVGIGVSMLAKQLQKPRSAGQQTNGVNGTLQAGGDVARSFILGRRTTAGSLVYANTWGKAGKTPNAYFTQVIALSDLPIRTISAFWVNGDPVTVDTSDTSYGDWGYPVKEYNTGNNNHMWIKFYDGTQTVADPFLVNTVSSADRPYQNSRVGVGVAYAIVTSQANDELFSGFPTFRFEVQGAPLYDVTKDSSAGGIGPQRWADRSTWGGDGDDLPVVQIYNILRGITYGGAWLYGLQSLTAPRLPYGDWIAQVNKCRVAIDGPSGPEPTYLTGIEVSVDTEISATVESLLTGCQGKLIETGGFYKTRVGEPGAAVYAFSDGDILSTEEQSFTPFFGLADTVNGVSATYPEPAEAWNTKTAPPLYNATFEAQDGNRRLMTSVDLNMVYRSSQVQRIMLSALNEARRARRHTFVLPPQAWVLEPGDIVSFTSNRNGYAAKLFRVDGIADHANLDVTLDLTEVDPSDYDWDQDHDYKPPVFAPLGQVIPPPQLMTGWQVQPAVLYDSAGRPRRPSIEVLYDGDEIDVRAVRVQVQLAESGVIVFDGEMPYGNPATNQNPSAVILNGTFLPNEDYLVRGEFVPFSGRATEWSEWLAVTTPNVLLGADDVYLPGVVEDLQKFVGDATEWIRDGTRQAILDAQRLALTTADQDFGNFTDRQTIRTNVVSQVQTAVAQVTASYTLAIDVATGPTSAIAQQLTTLTASVTDLQTGQAANSQSINLLVASVNTINGQLTAQADAITSINAQVGDISASANFRMSVYAAPSGYSSRIGMEARAGSSGAYRSASLFIDVPSSVSQPTRVAIVADQFSVTNGSNAGQPFIFQSGVLTLNAANIGTVTAGLINGGPGAKMVIDITNGSITVSD